jgi:pimeloyl-ACP methyl ester carboxylesterase
MLVKHGFKSTLIDLPSFGSRLNEKLTLDSAISVIKEAIEAKCSKDVILIGGSMGGYLIIETLGRFPSLCRKAVIMMCGQNIGFNRSLKASFGLWIMNKGLSLTSQLTMVKYLIQAAVKNEYIN